MILNLMTTITLPNLLLFVLMGKWYLFLFLSVISNAQWDEYCWSVGMIIKELTQAHLRRHISTDDLQVWFSLMILDLLAAREIMFFYSLTTLMEETFAKKNFRGQKKIGKFWRYFTRTKFSQMNHFEIFCGML